MAFHPNSDLVITAWLKGVPGLPTDQVGTVLPRDNSTWAASGFVQATVVGGSASLYLPTHNPVVQIDCWATNPNSGKPPWGKANQLAEIIFHHCFDVNRDANTQRLLTLPSGYEAAQVLTVYPITEPRRSPPSGPFGRQEVGDEASYARLYFDAAFTWREVVLT